jgi:hypothetical protein
MKKYTLKEIKKAWNNAYNENIETEYKGFINSLKNKYTVKIIPKNESPFRCEFNWDKVNDL